MTRECPSRRHTRTLLASACAPNLQAQPRWTNVTGRFRAWSIRMTPTPEEPTPVTTKAPPSPADGRPTGQSSRSAATTPRMTASTALRAVADSAGWGAASAIWSSRSTTCLHRRTKSPAATSLSRSTTSSR